MINKKYKTKFKQGISLLLAIKETKQNLALINNITHMRKYSPSSKLIQIGILIKTKRMVAVIWVVIEICSHFYMMLWGRLLSLVLLLEATTFKLHIMVHQTSNNWDLRYKFPYSFVPHLKIATRAISDLKYLNLGVAS